MNEEKLSSEHSSHLKEDSCTQCNQAKSNKKEPYFSDLSKSQIKFALFQPFKFLCCYLLFIRPLLR